jgi:TetR/AcrR family transcriptional regulator
MSTQDRKERERDQRRRDIIEAAERLLVRKGPHVTMEEIAADAGVAKGTLYLHFASKEDLFLALIGIGLDALHARFVEAASGGDDVIARIRSIGRAFVRFHDEQPQYFTLIHDWSHALSEAHASAGALHAVLRSSEKLWTMLAEVIRDGIDRGVLRNDISAFEMAIVLWTNASGTLRVLDRMKQPSVWSGSGIPLAASALESTRLLDLSIELTLDGLRLEHDRGTRA